MLRNLLGWLRSLCELSSVPIGSLQPHQQEIGVTEKHLAGYEQLYVNFNIFCNAFSPENRAKTQSILVKFAPVAEIEGKKIPLMHVG